MRVVRVPQIQRFPVATGQINIITTWVSHSSDRQKNKNEEIW